MTTCPVSNLPVTEKPEWVRLHPDAGYSLHLKVIGTDIMHANIEAALPVTMDYIDEDLIDEVLREQGLDSKPVHLVWDVTNVVDISYRYKRNIVDLLYRWGPKFMIVVFYNIPPSFRIMVESVGAIIPVGVPVYYVENYHDAISKTLEFKSDPETAAGSAQTGSDENAMMKQEFLAAIARISWFEIFDQQIHLPPEDDSRYPYFQAVVHLQQDLKALQEQYASEIRKSLEGFEQQLTQKIIMLNAQIELGRMQSVKFEQEKSLMKSRIAALEMELTRISVAMTEKTSALRMLSSQIAEMEIDQPVKKKLLDQCLKITQSALMKGQPHIELSTEDSEFLSRLHKKHPNLNQKELHVALLAKRQYDTRAIARSIGISTRGMESIRYRMHKKMNLDKHKSIKTYLAELAVGH
jgi:DNA-binding CsgD family transcriptional regulator